MDKSLRPAGQHSLFPISNQGLFSNNYLINHLPLEDYWVKDEARVRAVFERVKQAYADIAGLNLGPGEEDKLEDRFIRH